MHQAKISTFKKSIVDASRRNNQSIGFMGITYHRKSNLPVCLRCVRTKESGVEDITIEEVADEADAVYYNINGVRVDSLLTITKPGVPARLLPSPRHCDAMNALSLRMVNDTAPRRRE
mgnify:CR=1 FL=1